MENDNWNWELLAAYLSDNISDREKADVERWIARSLANKQLFDELKKIWASSGVKLLAGEIDSVSLLKAIKERIRNDEKPTGKLISHFRHFPAWQKVAAAVTFLFISYFVIRWISRKDEVIESGSHVATIYLPDSSKVWLNTNSRLTYSREFEDRTVALKGEGFFSVRKGKGDFTVTASDTETRVLGTAFNIDAATDPAVTLTVAEGRVSFSESKEENPLVLAAGEKAVRAKEGKIAKSKNSDPLFAQWRERNNPEFEKERAFPEKYISHRYTWGKNQINQSVIEGTLQSSATLAAYSKISLLISYKRQNGIPATTTVTIRETLYPGKTLKYRRSLLDIFTDSQSIEVQVKSAEITTLQSF